MRNVKPDARSLKPLKISVYDSAGGNVFGKAHILDLAHAISLEALHKPTSAPYYLAPVSGIQRVVRGMSAMVLCVEFVVGEIESKNQLNRAGKNAEVNVGTRRTVRDPGLDNSVGAEGCMCNTRGIRTERRSWMN